MQTLMIELNRGKAIEWYDANQGPEMQEKFTLISNKCAELAVESAEMVFKGDGDPLAHMAEGIIKYGRSVFPTAPDDFINAIAVFAVQGLTLLLGDSMNIKHRMEKIHRGENREDKGTN